MACELLNYAFIFTRDPSLGGHVYVGLIYYYSIYLNIESLCFINYTDYLIELEAIERWISFALVYFVLL